MPTNLTAKVQLALYHKLTNPVDLTTPVDELSYAPQKNYANGTGSGQADLVWHDKITVAGSGSQDIDLSGTLTNALGVSCVFAKVKEIFIENLSATKTLTIFGDANSVGILGAAVQTLILKPSGKLYLSAPLDGYTVTAATGDILQIANEAGASADVNVWIVGTST
jgi:hypothetical protein